MKDRVRITVMSGKGGDGCVSFRRERFIPRGGPNGGDGGRGGHVSIRAKEKVPSLEQIRNHSTIKAGSGKPGSGQRMHGRHGDDVILDVPPGTTIFDAETGTMLGELLEPGEKMMVVEGGAGGRGNCHFATPTNRVPRECEPGEPGRERQIEFLYSIPAEAAVLGLPGAGKSALVGALTRSRTKSSDYPFTTRSIHIGVVTLSPYQAFKIVDMPALVEGSSEGRGIGSSFLVHLKRVKALVFLLDPFAPEGASPARQLEILKKEIAVHDTAFLEKHIFVAVNKLDVAKGEMDDELKELEGALDGLDYFPVSAETGEGLEKLSASIMEVLEREEDE